MAFSQEADKNKLKLYWEYLKDLPDNEAKQAVDSIIKNNQWFPKIAEIRETALKIKTENKRISEEQRIKNALPAPDDRIPISKLSQLAKEIGEKLSMNKSRETNQKPIKRSGRTSPPINPQEFERRKSVLKQQKKELGIA